MKTQESAACFPSQTHTTHPLHPGAMLTDSQGIWLKICVNHKPEPWFAFFSQADYEKSLVKQENIVFRLIHYEHLSINTDVCVAVELWPFD